MLKNESDLKPYPFCGSDKILFIVEGNFKPWGNEGLRLWYRCHCYNCGADMRERKGDDGT